MWPSRSVAWRLSAFGAAPQHAQVTAAHLSRHHSGLRGHRLSCRGARTPRLAHGIGQGEQVVGARLRLGVVGRQADDLPTTGSREAGRVVGAQVVGVRLRVRRQRAEDSRPVGVDVGQRCDRGPTARRLGAPTGQVHSRNSRWHHRRPAAGTPSRAPPEFAEHHPPPAAGAVTSPDRLRRAPPMLGRRHAITSPPDVARPSRTPDRGAQPSGSRPGSISCGGTPSRAATCSVTTSRTMSARSRSSWALASTGRR